MSEALHSEQAPSTLWVTALIIASILAILLLFIRTLEEGVVSFVLLGVLFLVTWSGLAYQNMHYELSEDALIAWFWPFSTRVLYTNIGKIEILPLPWHVGIGLRLWFGRIGYTSKFGNALYIRTKKGGMKTLIITPENPDVLGKMIKERMR